MRIHTLRFAVAAAAFALCPVVAQAQQVTLRPSVESTGAAVTLGDLFQDAGAASGRAVAPAPGPGQSARFSTRFVSAAARAAGLHWTPPAGMDVITVSGRGASAATGARFERAAAASSAPSGDVAVRRGEILTLVYVAPGMQLTTRARATADASVGDAIRVVNLQSNRTVEATVTGVATASARTN